MGIIDEIQLAIKRIRDSIQQLENELTKPLQDLANQIELISLEINLDEIIERIIGDIKSEVGIRENIIVCIEAEIPKIKQLAIKERDALKKCIENARTKLKGLRKEAENIEEEAKALIQSARAGLSKLTLEFCFPITDS